MRFLRRQFLQDGDTPLSTVLSEGIVSQALKAGEVCWTDQDLLATGHIVGLLGQVLSADSLVARRSHV